MIRNTTYGEVYCSRHGILLPLYSSSEKARMGFASDILDIGYDIFLNYLAAHSKAFFFTLNLHYPETMPFYPLDNSDMERFIAALIQNLARKNYDPAYLWVRERDNSEHHHYHVALWLNGNEIQHPQRVIDEVIALWGQCVGKEFFTAGLVHYEGAYRYVLMLRRQPGLLLEFQTGFRTFSYLAKQYSKEIQLPVRCRRYGYSQLKTERHSNELMNILLS